MRIRAAFSQWTYSSSIRHRFCCRNSTRKIHWNLIDFERQIQVEIMTSTGRGNFNVDLTFKIDEISISFPHVDFLALNRHNWCACCFQSLVSSHFLNWEPILSKFGVVLSRCNFKDIDVVTDTGTIRTIFFGNFATTQINMNKDHFYLLQDYNANICTMTKYIYIFFTNKCF